MLGLLSLPLCADDSREAEQKLARVRAQIQSLSTEISSTRGAQSEAATAVREADRRVAAAVSGLEETDQAIAAAEQKLTELTAQQTELDRHLSGQKDALGDLVRLAYALGRDQRLKLLLAQDRIDEAARALAYQQYVQRDQIRRIRALLADLEGLRQLGEAVREQSATLDARRAEEQEALSELEAERRAQQEALDAVNRQFADQKSRLAALGRDEQALVALIAKLNDVFADIPELSGDAKPISALKGRLAWPIKTRLRVAFGQTLPDGRPSRGWLLAAESGAAVRAVAAGRVAFADWLRGYGLIVILDHGEGYMSLYAQNEALLHGVGDWVGAGERIARAGRSGGQGQVGAYFELRRDGKPIDPRPWLGPR